MKMFSDKLDFATLLAVVIFAISLSIMSFQDFSWAVNSKSYVGILIAVVLIIIKFANNKGK